MELRQIRYFVAVADALHFGRAAARLHISTPTLSQQIKALEREVGAPLLVRNGRGIELTGAGRVFHREAVEVLRSAERTLRTTRRAAGLDEPVRLGLLNGVPEWLPLRIGELLGGPTTFIGGTTADQLRRVTRGEVDLALVRTPVDLPPGTRMAEVAEEELGVLMSARHPLAVAEEIDAVRLSGLELVWLPRDLAPGYHDAVLARLRRLGADVVLSDSVTGAVGWRPTLLARPGAISLTSNRAVAPGFVWRPLRGRPLSVVYAAVWAAGNRVISDVSARLTSVRQRDMDA